MIDKSLTVQDENEKVISLNINPKDNKTNQIKKSTEVYELTSPSPSLSEIKNF